jgi:hypothetical protein
MNFAECVVDGGIKGARGDESTEFGDGLGEMLVASDAGRRVEVGGFKGTVDVDRVTIIFHFEMEYSRNLQFRSGGRMEQVFQSLIDRTRASLDLDKVKTIFGYKRRPWKKNFREGRYEVIVLGKVLVPTDIPRRATAANNAT